jgi:hypothetical protein
MPFGPRIKAGILLALASLRGGRPALARPVIYLVYGSDIQIRLSRIHAHPERDGPSGALAVRLHSRRPAEVRCAFEQDGAVLACEVIDSLKGNGPASHLSESSAIQTALKKSGYYPDAVNGRYVLRYEVGTSPDASTWSGASVAILDPLIAVFGAQALSNIEIVAPLAPKRDEDAIMRASAD